MTIRLFISYSHQDEDHRVRLVKHLAPLLREKDVEPWFDGNIDPGQAITPAIRKALRETDIFVALASHHYLSSDYCYRREYRPMLRKSKQGTPRIVVAVVGTCDWHHTEMGTYKALPNDGKSVDKHGNRNQAYLEIVQGIRRVVRAVRQEKGKAQTEIDRLTAEKAKAAAARRAAPKVARALESKPAVKASPKTPARSKTNKLAGKRAPNGKRTKATAMKATDRASRPLRKQPTP